MPYSSTYSRNPFGFTLTPWVKRLLIANAVVFVITLAFSGLVPYLGFTPALILSRPWTLVTYMFVHAGFFHLFFNMLALFFFGPPLEERWGAEEFVKFYLITGLAGALLSLIFPNQIIVGASAAIYGVMVAFAMNWPENPIYIWGIFPIKAKWLVIGMVGLSVFYSLSGGRSGVAHLAHLGGAIAAFLYLKSGWAPNPWGARPKANRRSKWRALTSAAEKVKAKASRPSKPIAEQRSSRETRELLDDVDAILDKISTSGLASLTEEERRRLDEASRKARSN